MRIGPLVPKGDLFTLEHRSVRDLAWSVAIGPILTPHPPYPIAPRSIPTVLAGLSSYGEPFPILSSPARWLDDAIFLDVWDEFRRHLARLDRNPVVLDSWMSGSNALRLGLRYERFLAYFFHWHPDIELLVHDLPVQGTEHTLGQFDFLFRRGGAVVHLEVAIKYYLRLGEPWETARCLGTDLTDRCDRKIAHGLAQQLALSRSEEGAATLRAAGILSVEERQLSLRGLLFDRIVHLENESPANLPEYWLATREELETRRWADGLRWAVAGRGEWFAPVYTAEVSTVTVDELVGTARDARPRLVLGFDGETEVTRGILIDREY